MTGAQITEVATVAAVTPVIFGLFTWKVLTRPGRLPWLVVPLWVIIGVAIVWGRAISARADTGFHKTLAIVTAVALGVSGAVCALLAGWRWTVTRGRSEHRPSQ